MLSLEQTVAFAAEGDAEFFAALPAHPGVFLIEMADAKAAPYLAQTADIRRAAERLLGSPDPAAKRLNLRGVAARLRYRATGSKFERSLALYQQTRAFFPQKYRDRLRLRPPALLKVNLRNSYPRCYVTRRIRPDEGFYFGPFPSRRAADEFNQGVLDLFKIRRCQIKIRRDPAFPGCVYSEMKMCLAPCFAGCTQAEYDADVAALVAALDSAADSLLAPLEREREAASEALDFERAAALHKRVEKVKTAWRPLPDLPRRIGRLDAVILQRGAAEKTVLVFPCVGGLLAEPIALDFSESDEPRSVEAVLRQALQPDGAPTPSRKRSAPEGAAPAAGEPAPPPGAPGLREHYGLRAASPELAEHLSLLSRWFYSKPREGQILFREADWPYRRILRACARLLAPPPAEPDPPPPA